VSHNRAAAIIGIATLAPLTERQLLPACRSEPECCPAEQQTRAAKRRDPAKQRDSRQRQREEAEAEQKNACSEAPPGDAQHQVRLVAMSGYRHDGGQRGGMDHAVEPAGAQQLCSARVGAGEVRGDGAGPDRQKSAERCGRRARRGLFLRSFFCQSGAVKGQGFAGDDFLGKATFGQRPPGSSHGFALRRIGG
jgi:hypothetical protein